MGKEGLTICPILILSARELGGKALDIILLLLLKLSVSLQPFSRSQLYERIYFKGLIRIERDKRVVSEYPHVLFKLVIIV